MDFLFFLAIWINSLFNKVITPLLKFSYLKKLNVYQKNILK